MSDAPTNPELLPSLGRLARGLSALFWGLPAATVLGVRAAKADWVSIFEVIVFVVLNGLLLFGLWELGAFQKQERPWRAALDRARLLGLVNLGLSPFLYWSSHVPGELVFYVAVLVLAASAICFLFNLNIVIERLGAMLPDETLRLETKQFTAINRWLLIGLLLGGVAVLCVHHLPNVPLTLRIFVFYLENFGLLGLLVILLLPLAMTMALIWKTKEVILESVFGTRPN